MGTLIVLALSNLCTMFVTSWLLHRSEKGLSPLPSLPHKTEIDNHEDETPVYSKGRPLA